MISLNLILLLYLHESFTQPCRPTGPPRATPFPVPSVSSASLSRYCRSVILSIGLQGFATLSSTAQPPSFPHSILTHISRKGRYVFRSFLILRNSLHTYLPEGLRPSKGLCPSHCYAMLTPSCEESLRDCGGRKVSSGVVGLLRCTS